MSAQARPVARPPAEEPRERRPRERMPLRERLAAWRDQHFYGLFSSLGRMALRPWSSLLTVCEIVGVPVIASGGAGGVKDFVTLFRELPKVDAGLAASIFHFGEVRIPDLKQALFEAGITVRR